VRTFGLAKVPTGAGAKFKAYQDIVVPLAATDAPVDDAADPALPADTPLLDAPADTLVLSRYPYKAYSSPHYDRVVRQLLLAGGFKRLLCRMLVCGDLPKSAVKFRESEVAASILSNAGQALARLGINKDVFLSELEAEAVVALGEDPKEVDVTKAKKSAAAPALYEDIVYYAQQLFAAHAPLNRNFLAELFPVFRAAFVRWCACFGLANARKINLEEMQLITGPMRLLC